MACRKGNNCINYGSSLCKLCNYNLGIVLDDFYAPIVESLPMSKFNDASYNIMDLDRDSLEDLIISYDSYIQEANDNDYYSEGWRPVNIHEYYNNEYKELMEDE